MNPCLLLKAASPPGARLLGTPSAGSGCVATGGGGWGVRVPAVLLDGTGLLLLPLAVGSWLQRKYITAQPMGATEMGRLMQRGLSLAGVFCACPALPEKGSLRARPPAQIRLVPGKSAASPAIICACSFVSGGRTSHRRFWRGSCTPGSSHQADTPLSSGLGGPGCTDGPESLVLRCPGLHALGLEATHTYCLTVLEARAWNQSVRAVSCWRVSRRNSLPPPAPGAPGDTCHNKFTGHPDPLWPSAPPSWTLTLPVSKMRTLGQVQGYVPGCPSQSSESIWKIQMPGPSHSRSTESGSPGAPGGVGLIVHPGRARVSQSTAENPV